MYEALLKATQEYQKIAASFAKPGPAALFGLPPAGRALLYAALQKDLGRVLCIVTPGEAEATHFADDLKALGLTAAVFPPRDFMLRPVEGAGREYEYRRLSVLGALAGGRLNAVCVPAEALLQYTVPRDEFLKNTLTLKPGMVYNREALVARLFAAGYVRRSQVDGPGQFSVRGDIVDIYAPDMRQPARVEYWDDEIDSMSSFDLLTQRRDGALEKIYLSPAREVLFGSTAETAEALRSAIKKARGKRRTALEKATDADTCAVMLELVQEIGTKLRTHKKKAGGIAISIRNNELYTKVWQCRISIPTQSPTYLAKTAFALFDKNYQWEHPIRSVTVRAINLFEEDCPIQYDLFTDVKSLDRQERLDAAIEQIRFRFGKDAIKNGVLFQKSKMPTERKVDLVMPTGMIG